MSSLRRPPVDPGIEQWADVSRWRDTLTPLAVRRAAPMMRRAAIPIPICDQPEAMLVAVRGVIQDLDRIAESSAAHNVGNERWWNDDLRVAVNDIIGVGIQSLSETYGSAAALDLVRWLHRNEIHWTEREAWWAWWLFFDAIARHRLQLARPTDRLAAIESLIRNVLSDRLRAEMNEAEALASSIPLSAWERKLVEYEVSVDWPEPGAFDVIGHMALAANRELARALHDLLRLSVTDSEWHELVAAFGRHRAT